MDRRFPALIYLIDKTILSPGFSIPPSQFPTTWIAMEIFMKNVSFDATRTEVVLCIAQQLHRPPFLASSEAAPFNFHVQLLKNKGVFRPQGHNGTGLLTFGTRQLGQHFLSVYGPGGESIVIGERVIQFTPSNKNPY